MHTICEHCERIYVDYRGWVKLLDMDNILCRREEKLEVVDIEECEYCDEFSWSQAVTTATQWEHLYEEDLINAIDDEYEFAGDREYEGDMFDLSSFITL